MYIVYSLLKPGWNVICSHIPRFGRVGIIYCYVRHAGAEFSANPLSVGFLHLSHDRHRQRWTLKYQAANTHGFVSAYNTKTIKYTLPPTSSFFQYPGKKFPCIFLFLPLRCSNRSTKYLKNSHIHSILCSYLQSTSLEHSSPSSGPANPLSSPRPASGILGLLASGPCTGLL